MGLTLQISTHPTPTSPILPIPTSCTLSMGSVEQGTILVPGQSRELPFRIYLPPCYQQDLDARYPVLYLLHGLLGDDHQWEEVGAMDAADRLISSGILPPFIIIMPWERTGIDLETALVEGLVPYLDQSYRTKIDPHWRGIGGLSRGGGQALQIGLRHPDLFGQISLHSPAVLNADGVILNWLAAIPVENQPALWIDIGERDSLHPTTIHLNEVLGEGGYPATIQLNTGDHNLEYWHAHVDTYLRWHGGLWLRQSLRDAASTRLQ